MKNGQATIKDIARELKISFSTVSRALKDYPGISEETKRKVKEMALKLNYRPNAIALSLRKNRSFNIAVIVPEVVHFFFSTVISGIEEVAKKRGYNVILTQTNENLGKEKSSIEAMLSNQIDGFLISYSKETTEFSHFENAINQGYPIIFFDRIPDIPNSINVMVDDFEGSYKAVSHLISQGYERIAHLSGPKNLKISKERERGYREALKNHGIPIREEFIIECPLGTNEEGKKLAKYMLNYLDPKPDAFFANNDMAAVGAMMACRESGYKIPEEIGIVGFSNWQFCSMLEPGLTSVSQPGIEMGTKATQLLLDIIEKKVDLETITPSITLNTELFIRKSSMKLEEKN